MAQILTQKIINNEILLDNLFVWIGRRSTEDPQYNELSKMCTQEEFVTCFLNDIHGLLDSGTSSETPKKLQTSISTPTHSNFVRKSLFNEPETPEFPKHSESASFNNSLYNSMNSTCSTSTPKTNINNSHSLNESFSPIRKNSNRRDYEAPKNNSFSLADFIVPNKKGAKKKGRNSGDYQQTTPKRINPTKLTEIKRNDLFISNENSFNFEDNNDLSRENVDRSCLKNEIEKITAKRNLVDENIMEQMKKNLDSKITMGNIGELEELPNPKSVKFKEEIGKIIDIYEYLLRNSLVVSVIGELHFAISLLFNTYYSEPEYVDVKNHVTFVEIFKNFNNVIYFASCLLTKFDFHLRSLDKSTLKFMCGNERLAIFAPNLIKNLENICDAKNERVLNLYEFKGKQNVCFVLDTDNRSNFPSEISFQSFKKQRDAFYEILKIWEDGHMGANWSFEQVLGRRIKYLLEIHSNPINLSRFSRLFMEQLLSSCERNPMEEISEEASSSLLVSLPHIDKNKFDRLKSRLVTKETSNGLNSAPEFPGFQEFYKEFIQICSNPSFLRHLCDIFISEIIVLNDTTYTNLDVNSTEDETDKDTKEAYVRCLKSLRILAKFLGFIESIPYKFESSTLPDSLLEPQIRVREKVKPNLDALKILEKSIANKSTILCIPWLCRYLSMLDPVFSKTSYYNKIIRIMIGMYRNLETSEMPEYNIYLVKYTLGWFFEFNNLQNVFFQIYFSEAPTVPYHQPAAGIDKLAIVDQSNLYIFCPYLEEIKKLLSSNKVTNHRLNARHITPLSAAGTKISADNALQAQLEEAFFNGQPSSFRKTVEFVAERIASTCVKHLCYEVVPKFKKNYLKELQTKLAAWSFGESLDVQIKAELRTKAEAFAAENFKVLEELCRTEVDKIVENNLKTAIHSLLSVETMPEMESLCASASKRMCLEKVKRWSFNHIVLHLLTKDITSEIIKAFQENKEKKPVFALPPGGNDIPHNANTESGAHVLDRIRDIQVGLLTKSSIEQEELEQFLETIYKTLTERHDVNEPIRLMISTQLVDLILLLAVYQPSIVEKSQGLFIRVWKLEDEKVKDSFTNLLCPRNIRMFLQADPKYSDPWTIFAKFCLMLLKEGLLSSDCFESQCTGMFKYDMPPEMLNCVTNFLQTFVNLYRKEFNSSKFTFLLEFLSDYCSDL